MMYRRPKFLEVILKIREEMAREADYDVDFFAEMVRSGIQPATDVRHAVGETENGASLKTRSRSENGTQRKDKRAPSRTKR
jgi:hypothetical protein